MAEDAGGDPTEAATAKRLQRAREAGQVPLSREAAPVAVLAVAGLLLAMLAPAAASHLAARLAMFLEQANSLDPIAALHAAGLAALRLVAPFLLAMLCAGAVAVLAQTRGLLHLAAMLPDLARLDPRRGLKRVFSATSLLEAGKSLLKLLVGGFAAWSVLSGAMPLLPAALSWEPAHLLGETAGLVLAVLLALLGVQAAIAGFDILRAHLMHARSMRMSRQEVREEHKEAEGDPRIKARIRRLRMQRARRRMLQAVRKAAVVVTNPTHFAVALGYQRGSTAAPRILAKGVDELAERIRATAREHDVPLVANPLLARTLYELELDAEIPRELYQAVAELIAYVWRLRTRAR
jgi:flagellar biosynthetic protein FlhB